MDLAQETDLRWQIPMFEQLDAAKRKLQVFTSEIAASKDDEILFHINKKTNYQRNITYQALCPQRHIQHYRGSFSV